MAAFTLPRPINVTLINVAVSGDKEQHVRTGICSQSNERRNDIHKKQQQKNAG